MKVGATRRGDALPNRISARLCWFSQTRLVGADGDTFRDLGARDSALSAPVGARPADRCDARLRRPVASLHPSGTCSARASLTIFNPAPLTSGASRSGNLALRSRYSLERGVMGKRWAPACKLSKEGDARGGKLYARVSRAIASGKAWSFPSIRRLPAANERPEETTARRVTNRWRRSEAPGEPLKEP